jgi:hypothetical protein
MNLALSQFLDMRDDPATAVSLARFRVASLSQHATTDPFVIPQLSLGMEESAFKDSASNAAAESLIMKQRADARLLSFRWSVMVPRSAFRGIRSSRGESKSGPDARLDLRPDRDLDNRITAETVYRLGRGL